MMQGLEEINRKVSTQFKQLELAEKETARIITRNKKSEIAKHLQHVQLKLQKLKGFKYSAHKVLFEEGEMGNLEEWSSVMEKKIARFDDAADRLKSWISIVDIKEEAKAKHEENIIQGEIFRRKIQEELKVQMMKLQMKSKDYEKRDKVVNEERVNMKLPKLIITKFDGTSLDLFRFWNQFESDWSEIDKTEISPVSNFSYLKELLIPRERLLINSLPFISEGYSRATSILLAKFGNSTEIAAAHTQCITSLPVIQNNIQTEYRNDPNY